MDSVPLPSMAWFTKDNLRAACGVELVEGYLNRSHADALTREPCALTRWLRWNGVRGGGDGGNWLGETFELTSHIFASNIGRFVDINQ